MNFPEFVVAVMTKAAELEKQGFSVHARMDGPAMRVTVNSLLPDEFGVDESCGPDSEKWQFLTMLDSIDVQCQRNMKVLDVKMKARSFLFGFDRSERRILEQLDLNAMARNL